MVSSYDDARAQCLTIPAESPIAALNPDDIPRAAGAWLLAYTGAWFEGRQNHVMGYVQTSPNEQRVWFTVNSVPHYTRVFYNRRFRTSATAPWQWAFNRSVAVLDLPSPGSLVVNAVLYSTVAKYGDGGAFYKYMMFMTYQPKSCDGVSAGVAMISYSNNGTCWTEAVTMVHPGGPSAPCWSDHEEGNLVQVESFDAVDAGNRIYLIGMEGDVPSLVNPWNMDRTFASWGYVTPSAGRWLTVPLTPELSAAGVVSPEGIASTNHKYKTYSYFINPAIAWDEANGDLYLTRAYPYPFDRFLWGDQSQVPSVRQQTFVRMNNPYLPNGVDQDVEGCAGTPATYPNRVQIYKMHLGTLSNFALVATGTWTLVSDLGNNVGYEWQSTMANIPIISPQTSVGRDYGAASFLRDGAGRLQLVDGNAYLFPATQLVSSLSVGPCRVTGMERSFLTALPH